jgi:hypothetical protein
MRECRDSICRGIGHDQFCRDTEGVCIVLDVEFVISKTPTSVSWCGSRICNAHRLTCIVCVACCDRTVIQSTKIDDTYSEQNRAPFASRNKRSIKNDDFRPSSPPMMSPIGCMLFHTISPSLSSASTCNFSNCSSLGVDVFERFRSRSRLRTEDCHNILNRAQAAHG